MCVDRWWVAAWIAALGTGALAGACVDYRWSDNVIPVCNETVQSTVQPVIKALDILFVIDNSGTMKEEQESLAANFERFVNLLVDSDADYQLGVINTDVEAGKGELALGWINETTRDTDTRNKIINREADRGTYWTDATIAEVFKRNIQQGKAGTSFEKGLEAVRLAFSPLMLSKEVDEEITMRDYCPSGSTDEQCQQHCAQPGHCPQLGARGNKGFLREGSTLGIVFVSDENDCSYPAEVRCASTAEPDAALADPSCISELDALFECDDKANLLVDVSEYYDFLVDEDGNGPDDTGLRPPKKVIVAGIIGVRDSDTQQEVCIENRGRVRKLDVACWPIDPEGKVPEGALGDNGRIYNEDTQTRRASFSVPDSVHAFEDGDVGKAMRITGATQECNNGVWPVVSRVSGENAVQLMRSDTLWEEESGLFWEMGRSPGMATEGSRYADFISQFSSGSISTICTFEWDETLERLGASFTLQFGFCLGDPPAGLPELLAPYAANGNWADACTATPSIETLVRVKVDGEEVPCADPDHPWHIEYDEANCATGSGYRVVFPVEGDTPAEIEANKKARRADCALEDGPGPLCFPAPGSKAEVAYLSQEGNSERCVQGDEE